MVAMHQEKHLSTALLTDMYELTMVDSALEHAMGSRQCVFEVFTRRFPPSRRFMVMAGVARILEGLQRFHFSEDQLRYLADNRVVGAKTVRFLENYHFSGDIFGYPEGEVFMVNSPILTVRGSFAEACLLETYLLSVLNFDCAIASAASRMTIAAHGRPCLDMGARRTHERAAVSAARAAQIGGFVGTSDLEAGIRYGVRAIGTAAHAFTLLFDSEQEAFEAQVNSMGPGTTLLVDTYDVETAVKTAVETARAAGGELGAVRLDSGDLVAGAFRVRQLLDELGATTTKITVTNDLDEYALAALGAAPVDSYGVGTKLVTGSGVPTAALVYKLVAREDSSGVMQPVAKHSKDKSTHGGLKWAGRVLESKTAQSELLVTGLSREKARDYFAEHGARALQESFVSCGDVDLSWTGSAALERAQQRHEDSRNELPYQAWRLSEGEVAIPTKLVQL
ncbi:nicotinate phosphoribosyltransferase [Mobiluncus mulieris]|uniref:Nicotinate phosphoribosyltransferase n=2 Tax=Mobiluncus mulieris TaxID=2052 RepID=A0A7Y0U1P9_9ACTO|nr:nicotinate phosphoribosyltransferase [Mobiluncus mulieris]NMX04355.1 nicotinate phosphoribosyltransferase [Mobiluncus mulieris]NMX12294.1 nicotinate phosphoribosyltransferase [Mobiluncus mulieris]